MLRAVLPLLGALSLAACGDDPPTPQDAERIPLDQTGPLPATAEVSPDTTEAGWTVDERGQAIHFGVIGYDPLLTLACELDPEPPRMLIVRHSEALPGQTALFPVMGNGMISRFPADAALRDGEWHWEAEVPADDPELDVFTGPRDLKATLPGHGMLEIAGSRIPGEFVEWCRAGGMTAAVGGEESDGAGNAAEAGEPAEANE